jgi:preprotein translocase subunit SecB
MADELPTAAPGTADSATPEFVLQSIYIKDASFEAPNGPNINAATWAPQFGMNMNTTGTTLADNVHEVVLTVTLDAKINDTVAYLVEVKQAGVFLMRGYSAEDARRLVTTFCPNVLFPYVRQAISDLINKGGFPPFLLPPVNFDALVAQSMAQGNNGQLGGTDGGPSIVN